MTTTITFKEFLTLQESVNDQYLFKCVFMAGGSASGKSFVANSMFKGTPVRFVSSDKFFEWQLKKHDLPIAVSKENPEQFAQQMDVRDIAKKYTKSALTAYINGMLPLVIDGTGKSASKIAEQKQLLEATGYDTAMVFVNTSKEVALQRNQERERTLPYDIVVGAWNAAQQNIMNFRSLFGSNKFLEIDNSEYLDGPALQRFKMSVAKQALRILASPLQNKTGKKILELLRQTNGKYLQDLTPDQYMSIMGNIESYRT